MNSAASLHRVLHLRIPEKSLIDAGRLRVVIDTVMPLAEARKVHERGEAGHIQGKIVLRVAEEGRG